jgi:hypothetical protein
MTKDEKKILRHLNAALDESLVHLYEEAGDESKASDVRLERAVNEVNHAKQLLGLLLEYQ